MTRPIIGGRLTLAALSALTDDEETRLSVEFVRHVLGERGAA